MTVDELLDSLPNGLHDAELRRIDFDYVQREFRFEVDVWVGNLERPGEAEAYRTARIAVLGADYLIIESPDENYPWREPGSIRIDVGAGLPPQMSTVPPRATVASTGYWMYLESLNRFLLFSGREASLEWLTPTQLRSPETGAL